MKQRIPSYILAVFCILFTVILFYTKPVHALPDTPDVIRVAYPIQEGITDIDENGNYCGYTYEFLEEVAQYTGWTYEFVQVPGTVNEQISRLMEMTRNGEIDLMGAMLYNEALATEYNYCGYSYGTVETVLQTLAGSGHTLVIDASRMQTMRIAVLSETGRLAEDLTEYCRMNLITPELIKCPDDASLITALKEGSADAILNTSMYYSTELRTIVSFSPRQFYFVTSKDNDSSLLSMLNEAIFNINQTDPYFQSTLYEKYFTTQCRQLILSKEENAYLESAPVLRVGVMNNQPPFQYKNKKSAVLKGISVDILSYISDQTSLEFTMIEAASQEQLYEMLSNGEIDIIAGMPYNYAIAREQRVSMTRPYIASQYTLLLNERIAENQLDGKNLALIKSSTYQGYFIGQVIYYDSVSDCIRAVNNGSADYTYVDAYTAQYYINLGEYANLKLVPHTYTPISKICFGITASADHALLGILNKVILSIPMENLQNVIYNNTIQKPSFSIGYIIHRYPVITILILVSIFSMILLFLFIFYGVRNKANKRLAFELQKHQHLYAISNDYIFEYDYKTNIMILSAPSKKADTPPKILHYDFSFPFEGADEQKSLIRLKKLFDTRKNCSCEERLLGLDGKWHWNRIILETICDKHGEALYAIGKFHVIDHEKEEKQNLLDKVQRDSLTHLYNVESCRTQIVERLSKLAAGESGALLLIDIDCFKSINDTYGHMRGDKILCELASLLQQSFPQEDIVGRPGGDEFLIYITSVKDEASLHEKCTALCQAVHQITLDTQRNLTISLGAALSYEGLLYESLYQTADEALYAAKNAGRNCYRISQK